MNIQISGHHLEVTPAIRQYTTDKLEKIKRHSDNVIDLDIKLSVEKLRQKAEAKLHFSGKNVFVESEDENLYAAIDLLIDKLDRQVMKHKEKMEARRHDNTGKISMTD